VFQSLCTKIVRLSRPSHNTLIKPEQECTTFNQKIEPHIWYTYKILPYTHKTPPLPSAYHAFETIPNINKSKTIIKMSHGSPIIQASDMFCTCGSKTCYVPRLLNCLATTSKKYFFHWQPCMCVASQLHNPFSLTFM